MFIGIDLGTSFSQVATYVNGVVEELKKRSGYGVPSVFYYDKECGELVGVSALNEATRKPKNLVREVKMSMGDKFTLDSREFTSEQIIKEIYKAMVELAKEIGDEEYLDSSIDGVVISHPAGFSMLEINSLCDSARNCFGEDTPLTIIGTIKEPVAAALTYYNNPNVKIPNGAGILVFDLGGGTCDVAVVRKDENDISEYVVEGSKMCRTGGRDWDDALLKYVKDNIKENFDDSDYILKHPKNKNEILTAVQEAKITLSSKTEAKIFLDLKTSDAVGSELHEIKITRSEFEKITSHLLEETMNLLEGLYNEHCNKVDIKEIILVGGSSRMPQVENEVKKRFSGLTVRLHKPETAVVSGTAIYANKVLEKIKELGYDFNSNVQKKALDEILKATHLVVKDVLPFSYGVRCVKKTNSKEYAIMNLLFKGSELPAYGEYREFEASSCSMSVKIDIYESGCSDRVYLFDRGMGETFVGSVLLDTPNGITEQDKISCKFTINSLDTIEVEAYDQNGNQINAKLQLNK